MSVMQQLDDDLYNQSYKSQESHVQGLVHVITRCCNQWQTSRSIREKIVSNNAKRGYC